ncbi:hypothetical protein JCM11491_003516 [Sporobolomyces phaffii]
MMQTPSPPLPLPIPRRSSTSTPTPNPAGSATSKSPPASSYTASLPATYRRSSFPVSPSVLLTTNTDSGATTTLPPGLTFERRGCRDDDDYERATGSRAPFFAAYHSHSYSGSGSSRSQSVESSRNNSSSSSDAPATRVGWLANSGRSWSVNSGTAVSEDKKKREAVKGWEDPALAAARRALWDDSDDVQEGTASTAKDEVSLLREKNRKGGTMGNDDEEAIEFDDDDDEGSGEGEGGSSEDEGTDSDSTPPGLLRPPCHSTLSPGPSCLRSSSRSSLSPSPRFSSLSLTSSSSSPPPSSSIERGVSPSPSSSHSNSSSCSTSLTTTPSIRFSLDPPRTVPTYSKIDYERKGDLPVEKLSIREWIELQGVREAVGVWSGKIAKWDENSDEPHPPANHSTTPTTTPASSTISSGGGTSGRPSLSLAALTGVVTVSKSTPSSPTSASPRLGSASLPVFSSSSTTN